MNDSVLAGKIALITGASRGIGKAITLALGRAGATVIGTATSQAGASSIQDYLDEQQISGLGLVMDVTNSSSIEQALARTTASYAMPNILVNNAGITADNLLLRMQEQEWSTVLDANLSGPYRVIRACLRSMVKMRWGRIINIGSVVGSIGNAGQTNYAAAKAGLIGFSKSLALEVGSRGITVNVVAPGFIDTDMTRGLTEAQQSKLQEHIPLGRMGTGEDIAYAVLFLASPLASYITGQILHVNGGMSGS
jgi:3-oxoacyl-[acyl-carrier protein] reductase